MKKILLVIDQPGWIFHRHALEISNRVDYQADIAFRRQNINEMSYNYDVVYIMDPIPLRNFPPPEKTVMGLRCVFLYEEHPNGPKGLYEHGFPGRCVSIKDKCSVFHVISQLQYRDLSEYVKDKPFLVVQQGVNHELFNPEKFKKQDRNLTVGIAGRPNSPGGKGFNLVQQACEELNVKFLSSSYYGKRDFVDMPSFYKEVDIYVCMSNSEGFCNPLLEAGCMGIPVITTNVGVAGELIKTGVDGMIIDRSVDELKKAIVSVADQREEMGKRLREKILEKWTWDKKIIEYDNMFKMCKMVGQ